jgi:hypothetical protein
VLPPTYQEFLHGENKKNQQDDWDSFWG